MNKTSAVHVLHFASLVNSNDFIDVILKSADKSLFKMSICTMQKEGNIRTIEASSEIKHIVLNTTLTKKDFFKTILKLVRVIRHEGVDIVHSHHYYESLIAAFAVLLTRKKLVISRHYHDELYLTTKGLKLSVYLWFEKITNSIASAIIAPSSAIVNLLRKQSVPPEKINLIPYGFIFNDPKYTPASPQKCAEIRRQLNISSSDFVIGNFARHHPIKAQDLLINSFAIFAKQNPTARLIMVGDGPYHDFLVSRTKDLHLLDQVSFMGWQRDVNSLISMVDVVVHPTRQEAFPQIMIEAMALEKPLVITPVSGASDIIQTNVNGFIIPFDAPEEWAKKFTELRDNPAHSIEMGKRARQSIIQTLDISQIIGMIESIYRKVIKL